MFSFRSSFIVAFVGLGLLVLAGCVGAPVVPPAPVPVPVVRPAPSDPSPPKANWENGLLTPGSWTYTREARGGLAVYGMGGSNPALSIRCDATARRIVISRPGSAAGTMTLRATTGARAYSTVLLAGGVPTVVAQLSPTDPQFDALAFSRGRFLVGLSGAVDVVAPSWPEVARVIEDCRG